MCVSQSDNQKGNNTGENDLHKHHQKHHEPLFLVGINEEEGDVGDLYDDTSPVYGPDQSAIRVHDG